MKLYSECTKKTGKVNNIGGYRSIQYITVLCWEVLGPEVNLKKRFSLFTLFVVFITGKTTHSTKKTTTTKKKA